jgi:hypothetical protein
MVLVLLGAMAGCSDPESTFENGEEGVGPEEVIESSVPPGPGGIEVVEVEVSGFGATRSEAIQDATLRAVEEVHGRAVAMVISSAQLGSIQFEDGRSRSAQIGGEALFGATSGYVTSLRILEEGEVRAESPTPETRRQRASAVVLPLILLAAVQAGGEEPAEAPKNISEPASSGPREWKVRVQAGVARYTPRNSPPLAIVVSVESGDAGGQWSQLLEQEVSGVLIQTGRASLVDREGSLALTRELNLALSDRSQAVDALRFGQNRVADLAILLKVDELQTRVSSQAMRTTNRAVQTARGSGRISYRVVDVASLELLGRGSVSSTRESEPSLDRPNTSGWEADMASELARQISQRVSDLLFPIRIIDIDGLDVTLNAGEGRVEYGAHQVFILGGDLVDPDTRQILGRRERSCCTVQIDRITERLAFGRLDRDPQLTPGEVLEVRRGSQQ